MNELIEVTECTHCGHCCKSGIPCYFGRILFNITEDNPQSCPALLSDPFSNTYWCGLIEEPLKYFSPLVGDTRWKCKAMADIARIHIGIGQGCGVNPSCKEIMSNMKVYANANQEV